MCIRERAAIFVLFETTPFEYFFLKIVKTGRKILVFGEVFKLTTSLKGNVRSHKDDGLRGPE
jgi:hypothetical protein